MPLLIYWDNSWLYLVPFAQNSFKLRQDWSQIWLVGTVIMLKQFQSDLGSEVGSCGASTTLTQVLRLEFYMVCNRLRHTDLRSTQPLVEKKK